MGNQMLSATQTEEKSSSTMPDLENQSENQMPSATQTEEKSSKCGCLWVLMMCVFVVVLICVIVAVVVALGLMLWFKARDESPVVHVASQEERSPERESVNAGSAFAADRRYHHEPYVSTRQNNINVYCICVLLFLSGFGILCIPTVCKKCKK